MTAGRGWAPLRWQQWVSQVLAQAILASPDGDVVGEMRRRIAAMELADLDRVDAQLNTLKAKPKAGAEALGSHLMTPWRPT